jgi:hypothetical protein
VNPNETNGYSQPLAPSSGDMHQEQTMPLGIGGFESTDGPGDVLAGAGGGKKANAGTILLVAVIVVGIAGLFVMKKLASANAAGPVNEDLENMVDAFVKRTTAGNLSSPEELALKEQALSVLNASYAERQVPLVNVQRNPFVVEDGGSIISDPTPLEDPLDVQARRWKREREQMQQRFASAAQTFELKSVMMSANPIANVSGKIVRRGDTLVATRDEVTFTVASIEASGVVITASDETYDLEVSVTLVIDRNN